MPEYIFDINPVPASRPRVTRWNTHFPKRYTQFKRDMKAQTAKIDVPLTEDLLYATVIFYVSLPKAWSKKKKRNMDGKYCDNNSDIDNYLKAILDSLTGVLYKDDKQFVSIKAEKIWSDVPRIHFVMEEVTYPSSQ
jgi:Holliday junction resolvase RusA-like endonuclease